MPKITKFDFAVFDCDGVILDSNAIKTEAFRHALKGYPESKIEELVDFHHQHGGVSRYEKIRYFFDSLVEDSDETRYEQALQKFKTYCQTHLPEVPLVPGVKSFLRRLRNQAIPMFVVSGSDEKELKEVLRHRQMLSYFDQVLGSPTSKRENLVTLLAEQHVPDTGVFFGDAELDYEIATEQGLEFVYVYGYSDWKGGKIFCEERRLLCLLDFMGVANGDSEKAERANQSTSRISKTK